MSSAEMQQAIEAMMAAKKAQEDVEKREREEEEERKWIEVEKKAAEVARAKKEKMFDGSTNTTITQALNLRISFPTSKEQEVTFYVTSLDSSCSVVLGHN
jgi:hypothetical protein